MGFKCKLCKEAGRGLFGFPNPNDTRRSEWLTVCNLPSDSSLEVTRHLKLCFRHFHKKDLDYHGIYIKAKSSKILDKIQKLSCSTSKLCPCSK